MIADSRIVGVKVRLAAARENGWKVLETVASCGLNGRAAGKMELSVGCDG